MLGPEYILDALNNGIMQAQASDLSEQQKIALAEHLGDRALTSQRTRQPPVTAPIISPPYWQVMRPTPL